MDPGGDGHAGVRDGGGSVPLVVLGVLCLVLIVVGMDNLILNVALPTLVR
jgi:hypothetical protein